MSGRVMVLRGDAGALPLPDESVDLIVTSPPYFGLRSYTDGGEHYAGQIGSEATPREFLEALWACTREWVRVLKPEGSLFVNLGDKYAAGHGGSSTEGAGVTIRKRSSFAANPRERPDLPNPPASWSTRDVTGRNVVPGFAPKSLMGMPWRYALGCIDDLGLILRAEIVWSKPNGLPESVTDRVRRSHEQVFHMVKQPRYFSAVDEVREPQQSLGERHKGRSGWTGAPDGIVRGFQERELNPLGKLPGSVWEIASAPLTVPAHLGVDHFAAYPPELVRRIVLGWSPAGICTACGQGRRPVAVTEHTKSRGGRQWNVLRGPGDPSSMLGWESAKRITGYACACPDPTAPTRPAVVLDPFGGTGTTALVASVLGRTGITNDRSADYCRLAAWRTADPGERARALGVPKPPPVPDGQGELFGRLEAM